MQIVLWLVLLAIFVSVSASQVNVLQNANPQRSSQEPIIIPSRVAPYPTHDPASSGSLPKQAYIPHPDELAYALKKSPPSSSFANVPSKPVLSKEEQRDIDLKRQLFSRVLVRCPIGSNTPSYHFLQTLGFKLQKEGRSSEAKRCFQDAQALFTSRVSLVGTGPRPDGPDAVEAARRSIPMADRRGTRVQDPLLQAAREGAGSRRRKRGTKRSERARRQRRRRKAVRREASSDASFTETGAAAADLKQPSGDAPTAAGEGERSHVEEEADAAGTAVSEDSSVEPWRRHPLSLWLTDGGLKARLAQVYSTQLAVQRSQGHTPFDS